MIPVNYCREKHARLNSEVHPGQIEMTENEKEFILTPDGSLKTYIDNIIDYPDISWGNYSKQIKLSEGFSGKANVHLHAE